MKVNKEIYYHAYSKEEVFIGDIITFNDNTHNKMYDEVYSKDFKLNGIDANELLVKKRKNNELIFTKEEFELVLNTVSNDSFVLRELAFEEVRKTKYPNYPSRLSCLYVTKSKDEAIKWSSILKRNQKECKQILTLELTGDLYIFDGNLIKRQNLSYQEYLTIAEKYWNSKSYEIEELLFYGEAKVIAIEKI